MGSLPTIITKANSIVIHQGIKHEDALQSSVWGEKFLLRAYSVLFIL